MTGVQTCALPIYSDAHHANVAFEYDDASLRVIIKDDGKPYDILAHKPVDLRVPFAEREIGGLGIHMIRKLMDDVQYQRSGGRNRVAMIKSLSPQTARP